MTLPCVQ